MAYLKPQSPVQKNSDYIYPLTTADQILRSDGTRLEKKGGAISVDEAVHATSADKATTADSATKATTADTATNATNASKLENTTLAQLMLKIYPVGAIYISIENIDPSILFGGTWEVIAGKFLLSASSEHLAGTTGGQEYTAHVSFLPGINNYNSQNSGQNYINAATELANSYLT